MLRHVIAFEIRFQLRRPVFWLAAAFFFVAALSTVGQGGIELGGAANLDLSSPFMTTRLLMFMTLFSLFATAAFAAGPVVRDFETGMASLMFTTRVGKFDYVIGRFVGAFVIAVFAFSASLVGHYVGLLMPWVNPDRIGTLYLNAYWFPFWAVLLPNLFISAAVFFAIATRFRSFAGTYIGAVAFVVLYTISGGLLGDYQFGNLVSMIDPFGAGAFASDTRYWSVYEKNNELLSLTGSLALNRAIWMVVGVALLVWSYFSFPFGTEALEKKQRRPDDASEPAPDDRNEVLEMPAAVPEHGARASWIQFLDSTFWEVRNVVRKPAFLVILALSVVNLTSNTLALGGRFGTTIYPVTRAVLELIDRSYAAFIFLIILIYSTEIVWRERSAGISPIVDSTPVPNGVLLWSKMAALFVTVGLMLMTTLVVGVGVQLYRGGVDLQIPLYLADLFVIQGWPFYLACVLVVFLQILANGRYSGMLLALVAISFITVLPRLGVEHQLYQYGAFPPTPYSDLNGYGHFLEAFAWFGAYWSFAAGLLAIGVILFWPRGTETGLRQRLAVARQNLSPRLRWVLVALCLGFLGTGVFIDYNTNKLNQHVRLADIWDLQADYERKYRRFEALPMPRIVEVSTNVALHPDARRAEVEGRYILENKTSSDIKAVHVSLTPKADPDGLSLSGGRLVEHDGKLGYFRYDLAVPLKPGGRLELDFSFAISNPGFSTADPVSPLDTSGYFRGWTTEVVENGSMLFNVYSFPRIGFQPALRVGPEDERRKRGLPPLELLAPQDDARALRTSLVYNDADWVKFETAISTSADQTAIAPGYLKDSWVENGRRFFRYESETPIVNLFSFQSARYAVERVEKDGLNIEVFYHPDHHFNVDRMVEAVDRSIGYFSRNFGPYQFRQARIVEFPGYALNFAAGFPNTVPFSERKGFVADLRKEDDIDYVFYVIAHELAHQWWGNQVMPAAVKGASALTETLAQYSALMVMEEAFGKHQMRRFLRFELDSYLTGRGDEGREEFPLAGVELQPYIHYRKGSLVMYALQHHIGKEAVNRALSKFLWRFAFRSDPYPTSRDLIAALRAEAGPEYQELITDLWEKIAFYELEMVDGVYRPTADGRYRVTLALQAGKSYSDGSGLEVPADLSIPVDVGVFGRRSPDGVEDVLYFEKHLFAGDRTTLEITVDREPHTAGIDPYHTLIDRNPDDNRKQIDAAD